LLTLAVVFFSIFQEYIFKLVFLGSPTFARLVGGLVIAGAIFSPLKQIFWYMRLSSRVMWVTAEPDQTYIPSKDSKATYLYQLDQGASREARKTPAGCFLCLLREYDRMEYRYYQAAVILLLSNTVFWFLETQWSWVFWFYFSCLITILMLVYRKACKMAKD